ncbi:unnamed protein product [Amaranthus hypochondriacus]
MQNSTEKEVGIGIGIGIGIGLDYWMKWQVPVCAFIIVVPACVSIYLIKNKTRIPEAQNSSELLWVPSWRKLSPKCLLFYRALAFLIMAFLLFQMILFSGLFAFYFYTQWTFTLVMVYFGIGTIISAQGCFKSSNKAHQGAGLLGTLMQVIYQTSAAASVLTDLVFWVILVPMMAGKQFELTLLIGCIHSLNAVFLLIDSLLNALPFQWFGFNYFILYSVIYVTFQWILHASGSNWWPYPFLELATPTAPLWYLGLAVVHVPCYAVYLWFVRGKNWMFSKLFQQAFVTRSL